MVDTDPESWADYYAMTEDRGINERLLRAVELTNGEDGAGRLVVDLGSGAGVESRAFLDRGWNVFAMDAEPQAIAWLLSKVEGEQRDRLTTAVGGFDEVDLPSADLVFAQYSLPFAEEDRFADSVSAAVGSVKPGGWFYGHLFGPNDDWAGDGTTAIDREALERHFADFAPVNIDEEDADGDFSGGTKHWHVFTVEAKRPD